MFYSTTQRFPTNTSRRKDDNVQIEIEPYKETTELTDENLAKPFKQISDALKNIETLATTRGDNKVSNDN